MLPREEVVDMLKRDSRSGEELLDAVEEALDAVVKCS